MITHKRVSYIENFFSVLLTSAGVSDNIFVGSLPEATDSEWTDLVLIEVQKMTEYNAYSRGTVLIYLYARPTGSPTRKNVTLLNKMEKKLYAAIEDNVDTYYSCNIQWAATDRDTTLEWDYNVVSVQVNVRKLP